MAAEHKQEDSEKKEDFIGIAQEENNIRNLPLLPLKDIVVFPHMIVPVFVGESVCINAVEEALAHDKKIFLSAFQVHGVNSDKLQCDQEPPYDVYNIGSVCSVMRTRKLPDGRMKVLVQGHHKARMLALVSTKGCPLVQVEPVMPDSSDSPRKLEAMIRAVRDNLEKIVNLGKVLSPDILLIVEDVKDPARLADLVASNLGLKVEDAQEILCAKTPLESLNAVNSYLSREIEVYQMQMRIQTQAKEEIGKVQREHYLREQIRVLKNELGDHDANDEMDELWQKVENLPLTKSAKDEIIRHMKRLQRMHQDSSEAVLSRTYVETVLSLPWGKTSDDNMELKRVCEVLDEDHFGLEKVKERILEYLAVKKLNPHLRSPILCFVGPPGVGKTSLGRSIARAMNRQFARIALGGVKDDAEIRGHRKTYVGAYPGRIITAIKNAGVVNPVIMFDEIDKVAHDHRGDPAAALLEVLDPSQNHTFQDHYLGVPFDVSQVIFIANANTLDTIPHALRDRLEIIEVNGYSAEEKLSIAQQFLVPRQVQENGLCSWKVHFSPSSIKTIIHRYTRESGLRNLEKKIASVCRKLARKLAEISEEGQDKAEKDSHKPISISSAHVEKFLGAPSYVDDFYHLEPSVGVALGMAYTYFGGEIMAIEVNIMPSTTSKMELTGQLGDVMKESAAAALSFLRSNQAEFCIPEKSFEKREFHLHVPAGAVSKDGPSAGISITTALLSAILGRPPKARTCLTGELTLHGKVLPIGGLKEKLLAAQREGIEMAIIPEKNRAEYMHLPIAVKRKLNVEFVSCYQEVFQLIFEQENLQESVPLSHTASFPQKEAG